MFPPEAGSQFCIREQIYTIAEHPLFPGTPYGQEGRQGTVYKLLHSDNSRAAALKIYRPLFRNPAAINTLSQFHELSQVEGLSVCAREILNPQQDMELLQEYPELLYSSIMPWIEGLTWTDVLLGRTGLSVEQCRSLALALANTLAEMEQKGAAHIDLSSSNLMFCDIPETTSWDEPAKVELIDVEDMFMEGFLEPDYLPEGLNGYMPVHHHEEYPWGLHYNRFSGGVLLAEILAWSSAEVRGMSWGESFFDPQEMQKECERFSLLLRVLEENYGVVVSGMFARVWNAEQLNLCPSFGEWAIELSSVKRKREPETPNSQSQETDIVNKAIQGIGQEEPLEDGVPNEPVNPLAMRDFPSKEMEAALLKARSLEGQNKLPSALWEYGKLVEQYADNPSILREIEIAMAEVQQAIDNSYVSDSTSTSPIKSLLKSEEEIPNGSIYRNVWLITLIVSVMLIVLALAFYIFNHF